MPSLSAFILRTHLRSGLRGSTRAANLLSKRLHAVAVRFRDRGTVYMDLTAPGAAEFWLQGDPWEVSPWEAEEQAIMQRYVRPNDVVYDIGAHIGLHTMLLSRLVGEGGLVVAFEPNPNLRRLLNQTIQRSVNIKLYPYALSVADTQMTLHVPRQHDSTGSLRPWQQGRGEVEQITCEVRRLDGLGLPQPSFIKIDVEGAELSVFRGAEQLLNQEGAPVILFEANPIASAAFGEDVYAARDFLLALERPKYRMINVSGDNPVNTDHWNLLAVPAQRA